MKAVNFLSTTLLTLGIVMISLDGFACAACGCSLSTEAAIMDSSPKTGWNISIQYDYINQNELRVGTSSISPSQVAAINNNGGKQEVEHLTVNRYLTMGIGYSPNPDWSLKLLVPYIDRSHETYGTATSDQLIPDQISGVSATGLGDIKFITSFQGFLANHNLGIQMGVKLPTGDYGGPNASGTGTVGRNPVAFTSGPNAGQPLDTSLQPGTGSTDLILGLYYHQPISKDFTAFVNVQFQAAVMHELDQPGQDYRPGNQETVSIGLRYEANPDITPQFQVNLNHRSQDQGALADTPDSVGTVAYLSPGISLSVVKNLQLFGFIQLPIYKNLDGYQLFPHLTVSSGIAYSF